MKLNPEIKQLRKENRWHTKYAFKQQQKINSLSERLKNTRINYGNLFVKPIFRSLTPREQKVLIMRFGFDDGITHTLEDVGKEFGVSRDRIRQIEAKALDRIREISFGNKENGRQNL